MFTGLIAWSARSAQSPENVSPTLKFEVATLKPSPPIEKAGGGFYGIRPTPGGERYEARQCPLTMMLTVAYRIKADQIVGGPDWMNTARFDMTAKAEKPATVDELHVMLKNLIADQFHLKFHTETKELPVYALMVDKDGPKLLSAHSDGEVSGKSWIDVQIKQFPQNTWHATFVSMDYFAFRLSQMLDRPVIDLTKLPGSYDFDLSFTRELPPNMPPDAMINGAPIDTSGPTIYEAVRKQLGLRLERQKGPVQIMVIDHVEKPTDTNS